MTRKTSNDGPKASDDAVFFQTPRLTYRLLSHKLADDLFQTLNNEATCAPISLFSWPLDERQITAFCDLSARISHNKEGLVFLSYMDETPVGHLGLFPWDTPETIQMGYWVRHGFEGQGLASEMLTGALELARTHFNAEKALATTADNNDASGKVLKKCGFEETGAMLVKCEDGTRRPSKIYTRDL